MNKVNQITKISKADKIESNYKIYLELIVDFYKKPTNEVKEKIFIGNIIRRVLEIVISFNELFILLLVLFFLRLRKQLLHVLSREFPVFDPWILFHFFVVLVNEFLRKCIAVTILFPKLIQLVVQIFLYVGIRRIVINILHFVRVFL